jgi:site-specific DNA recombinase
VSTDEQAEHGYSLGHQREECHQRALHLGATEIREFADEGVSGAILDRPGLSSLRAAVRAGAIGLVVVYDPDRLARKLAYQLLVTEEIETAGARLEFVNFEWRNTPEGQLFYALRGAVAQYEKEKIRERTMAGRRQKAKSGKMPSGFAAYGYTYDPERQTLVVNPTEADVVRRVFHLLVNEGMGINGIAHRLTQEGVPTRRGSPAWHRVVVRQIVQNPVYTGTFYANRMDCEGMGLNRHLASGQRHAMRVRAREEWIPVPVPPILDEALWRRAQEVMTQARRLMHTHPRSDYLLSGLVTCADCGVPMAGTRRNNWGTKVRGYTCRRSWAGAKSTGCGRFVRADPLEDAIWTKVAGWVADPDLLVTAVTGETVGVGEQVRDEIRQIEQALRNAEQGKRNMLSVLERHLAEPDECLDALRRIRQRIADLHARRRELETSLADPRPDDIDRIRAWAGEWLAGGALDDLPFERRRLLVRQLVVGVTVHEATLVVRARIPVPPARSRDEEGRPPAAGAPGLWHDPTARRRGMASTPRPTSALRTAPRRVRPHRRPRPAPRKRRPTPASGSAPQTAGTTPPVPPARGPRTGSPTPWTVHSRRSTYRVRPGTAGPRP